MDGAGGVELRPRLLAQFVVLADHGDVRRAAEALDVTPRALSRAVRELEAGAREPLLERGTRTVALTPAGARLVASARRVLRAVDRFDALALADRDVLRVAHVANADTLSAILDHAAARDGADGAALAEHVASGDQQLRELADHRLDLAVCPVRGAIPDELEALPLRLDPLVVVGGLAHDDVDVVDPDDGIPLLVAEYGAAWPVYDLLVAELAARRPGCVVERVEVPIGSGRELAALLRRAAGARVLVPSSTLPDGAARSLRVRPLGPEQPCVAWHLVWRAGVAAPGLDGLIAAACEVALARGWRGVAEGTPPPWVAAGYRDFP
ncbi:LysR family transcriptional regulator [Conexibacter woesei]|uniref:LysR family transcriptional regulator n=1 Tax=Conexibacter woesei TaxID=191495 RepID=UPI000414FF52|nr:LysR family transcriptional regulator [Conexibacter woesei]